MNILQHKDYIDYTVVTEAESIQCTPSPVHTEVTPFSAPLNHHRCIQCSYQMLPLYYSDVIKCSQSIHCTMQLHHPVHITFSAPLDHQRVSPLLAYLQSSCLANADEMFEEMVSFGYLPAPVAEVAQKMKQDVTG